MRSLHPQLVAEGAPPAFASVLVGIDSSPEALEATRQAAILAQGPVSLVASYDLTEALVGGVPNPAVPAFLDEPPLVEAATRSLTEAQAAAGMVETTTDIGRGRPWDVLLAEIEREHHTLVAVGSHGTGRLRGIVMGSTATELIHKAPCSVLVARSAGEQFPSRIVVGIDGSDESLVAYRVADELAQRFNARLVPLVASLDGDIDTDAVRRLVPRRVRKVLDAPVEALVKASADADLIIVGSRGLQGIKALGSVSERVAHGAGSSVLIVRSR
jgi:nucleotide-binding universal stress UspA family protein